jgi:hypothetical protein
MDKEWRSSGERRKTEEVVDEMVNHRLNDTCEKADSAPLKDVRT